MLYSAEARWFIPERLTDTVLEWFTADIHINSDGVKVHEYLLFPDCDSVGVKLRDGRFEIKARRGSPQPLHTNLGIAGRKEQWAKWSLAIDAVPDLDEALHQSGQWLKVRKERLLRRFSLERGSLIEVTARQGPAVAIGCNIELSRIDVDADPRHWFTFGFEAFGQPLTMADRILEETLMWFFDEHGSPPGRTLHEHESAGYPLWLSKLLVISRGV